MAKFDGKALQPDADNVANKVEAAINGVLAKSSGKTETQIVHELHSAMKRVGATPNDAQLRKIAKDAVNAQK